MLFVLINSLGMFSENFKLVAVTWAVPGRSVLGGYN